MPFTESCRSMNLLGTFLEILVISVYFCNVHCQDDNTLKLSKAVNCFTWDLYKNLPQDKDNIISSPFSADVVLSMLLSGAGGSTAQELSKALGYDDQHLSVDDMGKAFKSDLRLLKSTDGNTLEIANSVWIQDSFPVKATFQASVTQNFDATEKSLNFKTDAAQSTATINNWVNDRTNGLIPKLFDQDLDPSTIMVLVNAIYFKGQWAQKFNVKSTKQELFYNDGDKSNGKIVPLMHQQNTFKYRFDSNLNSQVLEMDYVGGNTSMVFILPSEDSSITSLEQALSCDLLKDGYQTTTTTLVDVTLPKYDIESGFDLIKPLESLNIEELFGPGANLTGIGENLYVSVIVQKAVIKVYEEGSEAAAATGTGIHKITTVEEAPPEPVIFRADRPFLYFIRHNPTGIVIFIGRVKSF